ncbi:MAG: hypothetical protein QW707_09210 [Candidatus Bathyarchaeia archaeon]
MDEDLAIFLEDFCEFLNGLEESIARMKRQMAKLVGVSEDWSVVKAQKPVSPNDKAIKWLMKRLETVKAKHPEVRFEFLKEGDLIAGLRYSAPDEESAGDIEAPAKWAFEKAASNPVNA